MLLTVYKTLIQCATPLLKCHLNKRLAKGKEDADRLGERFGESHYIRPEGMLFWFHAASVGEAVALLALVEKLLEDYPKAHAMMTTGTVTSARLIEKRLPDRAFHQYIPLDHPKWVQRFLDYWQPDMVVWSESEFWPNMLSEIKARRLPAVLLNAIISEEAFRKWGFAKGLIKGMLSAFQLCLAQDAEEAERLERLGAVNVKVSSNLKYAANPLTYYEQDYQSLVQAVSSRPMVLWASTHPTEEEIACRIHQALEREVDNLLTVILPRHPNRKDQIKEVMEGQGLQYRVRSENQLPEDTTQVYLADTLGEAGLFYKLAPLCVMGGTFVPIGGHNIIEPAHFGCAIVYGPDMSTCLGIAKDFEAAEASIQATDEKEMQELLLKALKNHEDFAKMGKRAKEFAEKKSHIIEEITAEVYPLIDRVIAHVKSA